MKKLIAAEQHSINRAAVLDYLNGAMYRVGGELWHANLFVDALPDAVIDQWHRMNAYQRTRVINDQLETMCRRLEAHRKAQESAS